MGWEWGVERQRGRRGGGRRRGGVEGGWGGEGELPEASARNLQETCLTAF